MAARTLSATAAPGPDRLALLLPRAVRFYLDERDRDLPGWRYPSFLAAENGAGNGSAAEGHEVSLDEELWQELRAEAESQEVAPGDLLQHAAYYYGAARDEGRLTERIAEELRREESGSAG
jgi:hypothetical protein